MGLVFPRTLCTCVV